MTRTQPLDSAGVERQRSLALADLVPRPGERVLEPFSVLDLGPASPNNLEFFGKSGARLTVADLYRSFARERRSAALLSKLLRYGRDDHFDLVLAWDVLNYLRREELGGLVESLAPHLRSGTLVHAFIVTARDMAPAPISYRIDDGMTLVCESRRGRRIRSPRYVEPQLLRSMPGLSVEHRFQLRNGMAEYVFTYRPRQRGEVAPSPLLAARPRPSLNAAIPWAAASSVGRSQVP